MKKLVRVCEKKISAASHHGMQARRSQHVKPPFTSFRISDGRPAGEDAPAARAGENSSVIVIFNPAAWEQ